MILIGACDDHRVADSDIEIHADDIVWRFDRAFLESNWECTFGRGCQGILTEPAAELNQGCCSIGAHFGDGPEGQDEAMTIGAYAALLGRTAVAVRPRRSRRHLQ